MFDEFLLFMNYSQKYFGICGTVGYSKLLHEQSVDLF